MGKQNMNLLTALLSLATLTELAYTVNYQEKLCELLRPELRSCTLTCPDGKVWQDGCPTCRCRSELCQITCKPTQSCSIRQKEGQYYGQITDYAVCSDDRSLSVSTTTQKPNTTANSLGTCEILGQCDPTGHCASPLAVCRSDGLCCRMQVSNNYNIANNDVTRCLDTPRIGECRALGVQYVFNSTTGKCTEMVFGGCVRSRNNFATLEQCQTTCELPCQKPKSPGRCRANIPRYYFNDATESCEPFDYGGCSGAETYFMTPWDCETHCKGLKKSLKNLPTDVKTTPTTTLPTPIMGSTAIIFFPVNRNNPATPAPTTSYQDKRQTLTNTILNKFKRIPKTQNRDNPDFTAPGTGQMYYRPRPQVGGAIYTIDNAGRVIYVNENNQLTAQQLPSTTPSTKNPTATTKLSSGNYYYGDGTYLRRLADRYRSATGVVTRPGSGMIGFGSPKAGVASQVVSNRNYNSQPQPTNYQSSIDALRTYLKGRQ